MCRVLREIQDSKVVGRFDWLLVVIAMASICAVPAQAQICDLTGIWSTTATGLEEDCGEGLGPPTMRPLTLVQVGSSATIYGTPSLIDGVVAASTLSLSWIQPEGLGATEYSGGLAIASSCEFAEGEVDWIYTEPGFSCGGREHIAATLVPEPSFLLSLMSGLWGFGCLAGSRAKSARRNACDELE